MKLENILLIAGGLWLLNKSKGGSLNGIGVLYVYEITPGGNIKKIEGYPTNSKKEAIKLFKQSSKYQAGKNYVVVDLKEIFF